MPIKFDLYKNPEKEGIVAPKLHAKVITKDVMTTKNLRDKINSKCTCFPCRRSGRADSFKLRNV
ncbi:hypothetical protein I6E11_03635 [Bacteroides caecigallinarum]|uniref:HU family DNA-binding protein n=1 Tax=Bacteroides caecigallinarum TaxID=1411144 RepID=UPI0021D408AD|nr:hypothetical protein [Bacteroides caecigallinarum]MCF2592909.1 hypothetical protein [Bacteroides caecigallinarum]